MSRREIRAEIKESSEELKEAFIRCCDAIEKRRLQAIWLFSCGKSRAEVREVTAYSTSVLIEIIHRYNQEGLAGLKDKRHNNQGLAPLLNQAEQAQLYQALLKPADNGSLWSGPEVAAWVKQQLGKEIYPQRGWDYLKKLGFSLQRPRPRHVKADETRQAIYKKT